MSYSEIAKNVGSASGGQCIASTKSAPLSFSGIIKCLKPGLPILARWTSVRWPNVGPVLAQYIKTGMATLAQHFILHRANVGPMLQCYQGTRNSSLKMNSWTTENLFKSQNNSSNLIHTAMQKENSVLDFTHVILLQKI